MKTGLTKEEKKCIDKIIDKMEIYEWFSDEEEDEG